MGSQNFCDGIELEEVLHPSHVRLITESGRSQIFQSGEYLYHQGDVGGSVYFLLSGAVKATRTAPSGHEALLTIHRPGRLLGLSCLCPNPVRNVNAIAMGRVETISTQRKDFLRVIQEHPEFNVILVQLLLRRLQHFHARLNELAAYSVEQRLALALLDLSRTTNPESPSHRHSVELTHEELANMISSRRQTVTAMLSRFRREGSISCRRGRIVVLRPEGLARLISD